MEVHKSRAVPDPSPKVFTLGERVEAIWSNDGLKYPGKIIHVFPNDSYDVLFDDGIKTRRKACYIFKWSNQLVQEEEEPEPSPPKLPSMDENPIVIEAITNTNSGKRRPGRPFKNSRPPPPPNLSPQSGSTPPPLLENPLINNGSDSNSSDSGPPMLTPKPSLSSTSSKVIRRRGGSGVTTPNTNGNASPNTESGNGNDPKSSSKHSKGFVYVQQPHYSVFDVAPTTELGKRQRRVHNYSMLAKGPSLLTRKSSSLSASSNSNGLGEGIDGESTPPMSTTPSSSKPNSRCSSPATPPVISAVTSTPLPSQGVKKIPTLSPQTTLPTAAAAGSFLKKRRFLKSPSKVSEKDSDVLTPPPVQKESQPPTLVEASSPAVEGSPKPAEDDKTATYSNVSTPTPQPVNSNSETTFQTPSDVAPKPIKQRRGRRPASMMLLPPTPTSESGEIPSKRLRKPSFRIADEGYVDIFSQRRRRRPKGEEMSSTTPSMSSTSSDAAASTSKKLIPVELVDCDKDLSVSKRNQIFDGSSMEAEDELPNVGEYPLLKPTPSPLKVSPRPVGRPPRKKLPSPGFGQVPVATSDAKGLSAAPNDAHKQRPVKSLQLKKQLAMPPINKVPMAKVVVEKCDHAFPSKKVSVSSRLSATPTPSKLASQHLPTTDKLKSYTAHLDLEEEVEVDEEGDLIMIDEDEEGPSVPTGIRNRWNNRRRWRRRGLLPGMKTGMSVSGSQALQLVKRSKFQQQLQQQQIQQRYDHPGPGRLRTSLLKGITKKRLKRLVESMKRRKLKVKKISAQTKFKDVRVDIINCVCGRTDEFGLMVQCEVCLCWQHGNCFGYFEDATLPRFYVCQSCNDPKSVRPQYMAEGIRQEAYKKGILPAFSTCRQPTIKQQKILKRCFDLIRMIHTIENSILQNRLKEVIATTEPEHKKLYQWSAPRPHPKDGLQKWAFKKYFKTALKRLLIRHKAKPEYMTKLSNVIAFREKLKKYSQAFEDAKLAIGRKIGSRGLILVEKLSEQEKKIKKIQTAKNKLDSELTRMPESMRNPLLSVLLELEGMSLKGKTSFEGVPLPVDSSTESNKPYKFASKNILDKYMEWFDDVLQDEDEDSSERSETESAAPDAEQDDETKDDEEKKKEGEVKIVQPSVSGESDANATIKPTEAESESQVKHDQEDSSTLLNEDKELQEKILRFNLEQLDDKDIPSYCPRLKDDATDNWVKTKKVEDSRVDADLIKVMAQTPKKSKGVDAIGAVVEVESESEATLSGDTTISAVDSDGGEEFWYNPITDLNSEYEATRRFLLHDKLNEYDQKNDSLFKSREYRPFKRDWLDELDFYLNADLQYGLDDPGSDDDSLRLSDKDQDTDEWDDEIDKSESTTESETEQDQGAETDPKPPKLRYWQRAIVELEKEDVTDDDEDDADWELDEQEEQGGNAEANLSRVEEDKDRESLTDSESESEEGMDVDEISPDLITIPSSNEKGGLIFLCTDPTAKPGEVVNLRLPINGIQRIIGKGLIVAGSRGQNFVKVINDERTPEQFLPHFNAPSSHLQLCNSCQQTLGTKWTWKQLNSAKGVSVVLEDMVQSLMMEIQRFKQLASDTLNSKLCILMFPDGDNQKFGKADRPSVAFKKTFEPKKLTEMCRDALSRPKPFKELSGPTLLSAFKLPHPPVPASAEEESILSLLSLSKVPLECNGENVSEMSIESLRKLTDRLQQNGPLTEDLAKAVIGQTNGKIALQQLAGSSKMKMEPACVRCKLREDNAKSLHILITSNPSFVGNKYNHEKLTEWCMNMSKAIEDVRLAVQTTRLLLFQTAKKNAQRKIAERTARKLGVKINRESIKQRLMLARPDNWLNQRKSEYMEALMPYATHFISRFTRKEEVLTAKRNWVLEAINNYNIVRKAMKVVFSVENEEERIKAEDRFYTALDNLRKSFDIVLTKKDIKKRREHQSTSISESAPQSDGNVTKSEEQTNIDETESEVAVTPKTNVEQKPEKMEVEEQPLPPQEPVVPVSEPQPQPNRTDPPGDNGEDAASAQQLHEIELFARLASSGPIQEADVNAILGLVSQSDGTTNTSETVPIATEQETSSQNSNIDQPLELDDFSLIENLNLKPGAGDMELINQCLGAAAASVGGTEDMSDLLLNFEDPMFTEPTPEEAVQCSSRSITNKNTQPSQLPAPVAPSLAKLTPEICKGFLLDDIRAHQQVIDAQLDRLEAQIIELERRRGNGIKEKDDQKMFDLLYANVQTLIENTQVLDELANNSIGLNNPKRYSHRERYYEERSQSQLYDSSNHQNDIEEGFSDSDSDS